MSNIMQTTSFPTESWRRFKSLIRSNRGATHSNDRKPESVEFTRLPKSGVHPRLVGKKGEPADPDRDREDHWEFRGGSPRAHQEPDEGSSGFQHEAISPSASLPVAANQSMASKAVHNRILIADDDTLVRGSLVAVLESEGYLVDEAGDGFEAVSRAIEHLPDLVLLDLNMPHWDGWTAFSQLDRVTPLLPVIVITARPNQYEKAVRLGVDAFMEKPLNIPVLVRAINSLTSEDQDRHMRRITDRSFVTQLLGNPDPRGQTPTSSF